MYKIDFKQPIHVHFIGIGGISMSGLAEILLKEHFKISGSDSKESELTDNLTSMGARIFYGTACRKHPAGHRSRCHTRRPSKRITRNLRPQRKPVSRCFQERNCSARSWITTDSPLPLPAHTERRRPLPCSPRSYCAGGHRPHRFRGRHP